MRKLKLGSLFDGSGGFPLAGVMHGIEPVWASEIEPFPIRVTKARFPGMKHLGSVTDVNGAEVEPVDIITFGSPCQDLSVAGKQLGIHDGQRSNLFFEAIRIIKEMRDATANEFPRFAVWENVPGAFSSNKGKDFQAVLQAFCDIWGGRDHIVPMPPSGKWLHAGCVVGDGASLAWRVYDAQYWGVPQRRKRIYLIADFGSERAGEILFKSEGVRGDSAQGGEAGQGTAADAERGGGGSDRACGGLIPYDAATWFWNRNDHVKCLNPWDSQSIRLFDANGAYMSLQANSGGGQNRSGVCFALDSLSSNSMKSANPHSGFHEERVTKTLDTNPDPTCNQGGNVIVEPAAFMGGQGAKARSIAYCEDGSTPTLKSAPSGGNTVPDVVYPAETYAWTYRGREGGCNVESMKECSYALREPSGGGSQTNIVYPINTMVATRGGKDDMRTCFGVGEPNGPQFTISAAHEHGVCYAIEGNTVDRQSTKNGKGFCEDVSPTLNTQDKHAVCYPDKARSLCARADSSPCVDRGQNVVAIDCRNMCVNEEVSGTLQAKNEGGHSLNFINPVLYKQTGFSGYSEGAGTLKASGGDVGGGDGEHCRRAFMTREGTETVRLLRP